MIFPVKVTIIGILFISVSDDGQKSTCNGLKAEQEVVGHAHILLHVGMYAIGFGGQSYNPNTSLFKTRAPVLSLILCSCT